MADTRSRVSFGQQHLAAKISSGVTLISRLSKSPRQSPKQLKPTIRQSPHPTLRESPKSARNKSWSQADRADLSPGMAHQISCQPLPSSASPSPLPSLTVAKRQRQDYLMGTSPPPFHIRRDSDVQMSTPVGQSAAQSFERLSLSCEGTPKRSSDRASENSIIDTPTRSRSSVTSPNRSVSITLSSIYDEVSETPRKKRSMEFRQVPSATLPRRKRSAYLRHRPSKLDLIDHKELTFFPLHSQAPECGTDPLVFVEDYFVSDSERNKQRTESALKTCTTCFAPLYEFTNFLDSIDDAPTKYADFACTKCADKVRPKHSSGSSRALRKAQSSYELRSRPPQASVSAESQGPTSSRPMWWESLSRKLRWRWRTKGLIPKDVIDLLNPPPPPSHY